MKKIIVLAVVFLGLSLGSASAQQGKVYVSTGSISLGFGTSGVGASGMELLTGFRTDSDNTIWGIAPEVGYYISDNVAIGIGVGYADYDVLGTLWGVNPYLRYFAYKVDNFSFYGQADFNYISIKDGPDSFNVGVIPGIQYTMTENFAVNAAFGFLGYRNGKGQNGTFGLDLNAKTLSFGLTYSF